MNTVTLNQRDIDFLLYEFLDTESLLSRERYAEHSRESFDATINGAKNIAEKYYGNHCLLYTSPSPRDGLLSRMPSSA